MLAMTEAAVEAINALTQNEEQPDEGGLRLAVSDAGQDGSTQLSLAVSDAPEEGDQVVGTESGAKVFMESKAADFLDDKVLDVRQDEAGQVSFAVFPQEAGDA
ncbi:MAG: iron-sulfur cluster biosynthesis family protein [Haloechinothrix sp.]